MTGIARLGDTSSHGGQIISASADNVMVDSLPSVVTGDQHSCPIPGHGVTALTGTSSVTVAGKKLVKIGDQAGCGAVIIKGSTDCNSG